MKEKVESAKLFLSIGSLGSDFNTGNFSYNIPTRHSIEVSPYFFHCNSSAHLVQLHSNYTKVQYATFSSIGMKQLLPKLTLKLEHFKNTASKIPVVPFVKQLPAEDTTTITQLWLWPRLAYFFEPKDVIVTETGALITQGST